MKILLISGSRRRNSFNTQLMMDARNALEETSEIKIGDWKAIPFFDQDDEIPVNSAVDLLRKEFQWAEAVWFFTPEYNGQIPGGLKNMLDWMSRPLEGSNRQTSVLWNKPACISGAGGRGACRSARAQMETLLRYCGMKVCPDSVGIALSAAEFGADAFSDPTAVDDKIKAQAQQFVHWLDAQTPKA